MGQAGLQVTDPAPGVAGTGVGVVVDHRHQQADRAPPVGHAAERAGQLGLQRGAGGRAPRVAEQGEDRHHAQAPPVGRRAAGTVEHLRGDEAQCARHRGRGGAVVRPGRAEVDQHGPPVRAQDHVARVDVPVEDPLRVQLRHSGGQVAGQDDGLTGRQGSGAPQAPAVDPGRRDVEHVLVPAGRRVGPEQARPEEQLHRPGQVGVVEAGQSLPPLPHAPDLPGVENLRAHLERHRPLVAHRIARERPALGPQHVPLPAAHGADVVDHVRTPVTRWPAVPPVARLGAASRYPQISASRSSRIAPAVLSAAGHSATGRRLLAQ